MVVTVILVYSHSPAFVVLLCSVTLLPKPPIQYKFVPLVRRGRTPFRPTIHTSTWLGHIVLWFQFFVRTERWSFYICALLRNRCANPSHACLTFSGRRFSCEIKTKPFYVALQTKPPTPPKFVRFPRVHGASNPVNPIRKGLPGLQNARSPIVSYCQVQGLSSTRFWVGVWDACPQSWEEDGSLPMPGIRSWDLGISPLLCHERPGRLTWLRVCACELPQLPPVFRLGAIPKPFSFDPFGFFCLSFVSGIILLHSGSFLWVPFPSPCQLSGLLDDELYFRFVSGLLACVCCACFI